MGFLDLQQSVRRRRDGEVSRSVLIFGRVLTIHAFQIFVCRRKSWSKLLSQDIIDELYVCKLRSSYNIQL